MNIRKYINKFPAFTLAADIMAILVLSVFIIWMIFPTNFFIREVGTSISDDGIVTFNRVLPFGSMQAQWTSEVYVIDTGKECSSGPWVTSFYQSEIETFEGQFREVPYVRYSLHPWATECIEADSDYVLVESRKGLIFGVIPLRVSRVTTIVHYK